ncbi:uncharacterized protein LOC113514371 [Galleria mellonella]|uniref:Uncharacterized protein LOC113514371 n=1 Tax=Galleria mellonella TaxID=7137 RepID=A0A6J1WIK4_GALME|nr:uncharacterized protein LOC113514371 [Galleria mellonella]
MSTIVMQRDLVVTLKKETCLNVGILSKLQLMPTDLSRLIFKENALEKPTQNLFNHLTYYLVSIIDSKVSVAFSWPLYDSKTERTYRNQLSVFINDYSSKGLLSPVMSSYLVNPGCFKVTILIFQLSQLAVQRVLLNKMNRNRQKELYDKMTEKYKRSNKGFLENIEVETETMLSKFSNYLLKRKAMEEIAGIFRKKITEMETKLLLLNVQQYIDDLVDKYVENHPLDECMKTEILKIKNIHTHSKYFDLWLDEVDEIMNKLETKWVNKILPLLEISERARCNTEALIARHTGEADKNSYMIEYTSSNEINTIELQDQVNSEQKYILKNIVKNDRLNFPNLIRGFLISIYFMLKNTEIGDEIYKFNEYLEDGSRNFSEIVSAMKVLLERVMNAEARLESSSVLFSPSFSMKDVSEIPPLPDLSDLKANKDLHCQIIFDTLTPFSISKHQFNLHRKNFNSFARPQTKSLLSGPFHQLPRDDFLKSLISCRVSSYDRLNSNFHNMSVISQNYRGNETIAECSSGFTKQQIARLLSTKKSSSTKKFKCSVQRPNINIKKGALFNESNVSNENGLYRSYSSPNLFENREKKSHSKLGKRKLSIMQEDMPSLLEVSGIAMLESDNSYGTPDGNNINNKEKSVTHLPAISISPAPEAKVNNILRENKIDFNGELTENSVQTVLIEDQRKSIELKEESKSETPKTDSQLIRRTSSLEKIINRFKKVRANVVSDTSKSDEFKTIVEEKENFNSVNVDVFTANRILLPDLLSPSCSIVKKSTEFVDTSSFDIDEKECRRPRESLGMALGVDKTFLDQFDLID